MSDSATPWIVAYKAALSMEFSRKEYWSGLPFPSPGDLPDPGIEPESPAVAGGFLPAKPPRKPSLRIGLGESHKWEENWGQSALMEPK